MADPASTPVDALIPAMTLLAAGGAAALVCKALRLSPIVGYLAVGILIGPDAFHLIQESSTTHLLAELGVVFLLFDIGLHVSLRELRIGPSRWLSACPLDCHQRPWSRASCLNAGSVPARWDAHRPMS